MLFKNVASQKIHVYAYDSTTGAAKTGDAANITAYVSLDGTANAIDDTNPTEVDATNMPGVYVFDLTQAETNCNSFALYAKSATANIRIEPIIGFTTGAANALSVNTGTITNDAITAAAIATDAGTEIGAAVKTAIEAAGSHLTLVKTKTDYLPSVAAGAAGGVFIAGTNAPVVITGSGNALSLISTGADGSGLVATGNSNGHGINATGGVGLTSWDIYCGGNGDREIQNMITNYIDPILLDTDELQQAIADGGRTDLLIDAIKAKTDSLTFTVAGDLDANVQSWAGASVATPSVAGVPEVDLTYVGGVAASGVATVDANVVTIAANAITATSIATGALTAAKFAAGAFDAVWTVAARTLTAISDSAGITTLLSRIVGTLAAGTHTAQSGDAYGVVNSGTHGNAALHTILTSTGVPLTSAERTSLAAAIEAAIINELDGTAVMQAIADLIASDMTTGDLTVQAIASAVRDAVLNRVLAGNHDTAGSVGKVLQDVLEDTGTTIPSTLTTITGYVDCLPVSWVTVPTAAATADAVWDELLAGHSGVGSAGLALTGAGAAGDPWSTALPGAYAAGTAGYVIGNIVDDVWSNGTRTLTAVAVDLLESLTSAPVVTRYRGTSWSLTYAGLGSIAGRLKLYFTMKRSGDQADERAVLQIEESVGATVLHGGVAADPTVASITVTDEAAGDLTIVVKTAATASFAPSDYVFDLKYVRADGEALLLVDPASTLRVLQTVTRAID